MATRKLASNVRSKNERTAAAATDERPAKKAKLLDDDSDQSTNPSDSDGDDSTANGISLKVNEDYARRFEHNKKRAELQRLQDKYGKFPRNSSQDEGGVDSNVDSEEGVSEDDAAELATEALDAEISATLAAIRSRDPRVYDKNASFYRTLDSIDTGTPSSVIKEKPMTLKDYHTKNLLEGHLAEDDTALPPVKTYNEEMEEAKQRLLHQVQQKSDDDTDTETDEFLVTKSKSAPSKSPRAKITDQDVENAEKDPETFLSNFMAARAWLPTNNTTWKPLQSDDSEEDERAEEYEDAYNMFFEDPAHQNENLVTYARDAVAGTTVRREEKNSRRKAREAARAKREAEKQQREEELARFRKLKVEEMENKVKQIRKIGGLTGKDFKIDEWAGVLEADWSDDQWDAEMQKRFGDAYYDDEDHNTVSASEGEPSNGHTKRAKRRSKKPKFDDDIDITDIVPDFDREHDDKRTFTLSSDDEKGDGAGSDMGIDTYDDMSGPGTPRSSNHRKQERAAAKGTARRDRRLIETLVDSSLSYQKALASNPNAPTGFRYRETSPTSFGLTPRDILLASDAQLNEFAGLKKLATFRDPAKKKKDKKHLSKKARLRQWRLDTFGDMEGPTGGFELLLGDESTHDLATDGVPDSPHGGVDIREDDGSGKKKKKRSRKRKANAVEA